MIERIYAIYDRKARMFMKGNIPFVIMYPNDDVARREFTEIVHQIPHLKKYPDDYVLLYVGSVNSETGVLLPTEGPPAYTAECQIMNAGDAIQLAMFTEPVRENKKEPETPAPEKTEKKKVGK